MRRYRFRVVGTNDFIDHDAYTIFIHGEAVAFIGAILGATEIALLEGTDIEINGSSVTLTGKDY